MIGRVVAAAYVGTVAALTVYGFVDSSPAPILLATALALPCGAPALIAYYVAYGLLVQLPTADQDGGWFPLTVQVIGVVALAAAAAGNVVLVRRLRLRRHA